MKRTGHFSAAYLAVCLWLPFASTGAEIHSVQSGNWGSALTWSGGAIPTLNDNVTISSGDTVIVESSSKQCHDLIVEPGGMLFSNNSSTGSNPRYIYLYGNILCNGRIGNDTVYDLIAFNTEGDSCIISGDGMMDVSRIRKYLDDADTTVLILRRNLNLRFGGTALYNGKSSTVFHITIDTGAALNLPGNGVVPGNLAIDGINGAASTTGGGSVVVRGELRISGILYLTNSNSANPVWFTVSPTGEVHTASVSCSNSGASGHTLTLEAGSVFDLTAGDWGSIGFQNNTYLFQPGSTLVYSGDTSQSVVNPAVCHHLVLTGQGTKTMPVSMEIGGDLTIEPPAKLVLQPGIQVTVSGTCILLGSESLLMQSPPDTGATASFIPEGGMEGPGTAVVERYLTPYETTEDCRYHLLSSPVANQLIQPEFMTEPPLPEWDFYRWEEQLESWINCKSATGSWNSSFQPGDDRTFHSGTGYLVAYPEAETRSFTGILNAENTMPVLTYTQNSSGEFTGFNLVGNPFPSALEGEIQNWEKSSVDNAVWVWDGETGNYLCWNGELGTLPGGIIPAMQGFFVHANDTACLLTIPASSRVHATEPVLKKSPANTLWLDLLQDGMKDAMVAGFREEATEGYNPLQDVMKLHGSSLAPQLYSMDEEIPLSVDLRPYHSGYPPIPLVYETTTAGELSLLASGMDGFPAATGIFLEDRTEQQLINLRQQSSYSFYSESGLFSGRFTLRFGDPASVDEPLPFSRVRITSEGSSVVLSDLPEGDIPCQFRMYNLRGSLILSAMVSEANPKVDTHVPTGYYLVTILCGICQVSDQVFLYRD